MDALAKEGEAGARDQCRDAVVRVMESLFVDIRRLKRWWFLVFMMFCSITLLFYYHLG